MAGRLSEAERQTAYRLLGVCEGELLEIEHSPYPDGPARLEALKERVRKTFKTLVREHHPDLHPGDSSKQALLILLIEATKELAAKQVHREARDGVAAQHVWVAEPVSSEEAAKPFMRMHVKRPSSSGLHSQEKAIRLGKMRP